MLRKSTSKQLFYEENYPGIKYGQATIARMCICVTRTTCFVSSYISRNDPFHPGNMHVRKRFSSIHWVEVRTIFLFGAIVPTVSSVYWLPLALALFNIPFELSSSRYHYFPCSCYSLRPNLYYVPSTIVHFATLLHLCLKTRPWTDFFHEICDFAKTLAYRLLFYTTNYSNVIL